MPKRIRTFVDSGVLLYAARGNEQLAGRALQVLDDPDRTHVTSEFVRLEVLPKPLFHRQAAEAEFYLKFFENADRLIRATSALVAEAQAEAERSGLSAIDALHVAAARRGRCDELVTTETTTKPLFRVTGIRIVSIHLSSGQIA
ncbi:MAG: PIN domain-containing protein [Planctomycetes bacterium]|nr:PIN domain-containing protein [Planctomycetota bacterium]